MVLLVTTRIDHSAFKVEAVFGDLRERFCSGIVTIKHSRSRQSPHPENARTVFSQHEDKTVVE
jgi:hypothetical protein